MQDAYNWLKQSFKTKFLDGNFVLSSIVPLVFDRYFIIEHNYGIIDDFPFDAYPDDTQDIDNLNKRHNIERQFGLFLNYNRAHLYRPISIKAIAERFGVPYSKDTLSLIKHTAGIEYLHERSMEHLLQLLQTLISAQCYLYIHDIEGYYPQFDEKNVIDSAEQGFQFINEIRDSYGYLFSYDRSWCIIVNEKMQHFVLACNNSVIPKLAAIEGLEYFEIYPDTAL